MILFLDDSEMRIQLFLSRFPDAMIVRTAEEAIDVLRSNHDMVWEAVWLDHDLGGETLQDSRDPNSGYEVARWIISNQPSIAEIYVHSWNPVAASEMVIDLAGSGFMVHRVPFDPSLFEAGNQS